MATRIIVDCPRCDGKGWYDHDNLVPVCGRCGGQGKINKRIPRQSGRTTRLWHQHQTTVLQSETVIREARTEIEKAHAMIHQARSRIEAIKLKEERSRARLEAAKKEIINYKNN